MLRDKWLSHAFCTSHGLPFVPSIARAASASAPDFIREHGLPLLSKPRRGFSAIGIHVLFDERQVHRALEDDDMVVQKFLGDPAVVKGFVDDMDARGIPLFQGGAVRSTSSASVRTGVRS